MYLVVFRNTKRADIDADEYGAEATWMAALAAEQQGFISFKSYLAEDGEVVAISEWADEAAAQSWRKQADHAEVQSRGRAEYYASYTLYAGTPSRVHRFP